MGGVLWILPISFGDFAHKEGASEFNRNRWSVFREFALVQSDMEQIKDVKGSFFHLFAYFDDYCQILELFLPFERKKFWHDTFKRSFDLING